MAVAVKPRPKLSLEDYECFVHLPDQRGLTLEQLQQIVLMHGFAKIKTKTAIVAGMRHVDMMPPARSTLRVPSTYPCAALSVGEIRADVAALGWQECPLGSVVSVGPRAGSPPVVERSAEVTATPIEVMPPPPPPAAAVSPVGASGSATKAAAGGGEEKKRRKRKRRSNVQLAEFVLG